MIGVTLTPQGYDRTRLRSQLLIHWRALDGLLAPLTGQDHTFTRASTAEGTDVHGATTGPVPNNLAVWESVDTDSDTVRDALALRLAPADSPRAVDALAYDFPTPLQAMTVYAKLAHVAGNADGARVLHIGDGADGGHDPRLWLYWATTPGEYRAAYDNGTATATDSSLATAPSAGDIVELAVRLYADGSVQILQRIDGGTVETGTRTAAPSGGIVTRSTGQKLGLGSVGDGDDPCDAAYLAAKVAPGTDWTMDEIAAAL